MATVKELKATARPKSGKGAARAERRAGRVPGVIYGNNQPPLTISIEDRELRTRILAGRFLTTLVDIDLEGNKHRVIPRDYHLDPVKDFPIHVDFMRLGEGATIRISVPLHVVKAEGSARREARRRREHRCACDRARVRCGEHPAVHRG
ncbi:ribosomal protein bL25 (Ctc-form) [Bradyrhizobium sp. LM3.2]